MDYDFTFTKFKASDADGTFPALLQKGESRILSHLVKLMRDSLAQVYILKKWRTALDIHVSHVVSN